MTERPSLDKSASPSDPTAELSGSPETTATPATPTTPAAPAPTPVDVEPRRPRTRTVVLGAVLLAISVMVAVNETTSVNLDRGWVLLVLLIGAGLALVLGGAGGRSGRDR